MTVVNKEITLTSVPLLIPNQQLNHTSKAKGESTSTVQENHKTYVAENLNQALENRIQRNWRLIMIMLSVLTLLTFTYFGKCVHRHWRFRTIRVKINNTTPTIALGETNQTENSYDSLQSRDYDEPRQYQTTAGDTTGETSNFIDHENSPENMVILSTITEDEPRSEKSLNNLYISPCM